MTTENLEADLIATQLRHAIDLLRFEIKDLRTELRHFSKMVAHRLDQLEASGQDHETRLHSLQDGVTTVLTLAFR